MNTHRQIHSHISTYGGFPINTSIKRDNVTIPFCNIIAIDQFFSLPQNLRNGFVDTSPTAFDNPQASAHAMPVGAERPLPADMTDDEIHASVISKSCQTMSELQELTKFRPKESDFDTLENIPTEEPPAPAETAPSE